ncbi:T9SS type A sorting domain-containing protein [uncultured Winogradskyella sp.]|uniref:T9SS type A sorting domain-containing protein n=1 Tax=uncultured Winogradskyella sp. TaxID=395353 RepID=UPI0030DC1198|tara:strand:- start:11510 stop:13381 length:1872 start_codon:yes stop_codon:yes gene_type:complete
MKKITFSLILLFLFIGFSNAQNTCADATSLCGSFGSVFPNTTVDTVSEPNFDYGCLGSQPRPTWFYIPIATTGDVNFQISQFTEMDGSGQLLDVDFIVWGPFTDVTCSADDLMDGNIVDCSFSASAVENVEIPSVLPGEIYMLMVTNFSGSDGFIEMTETTNTNFFDTVDCTGFILNAFIDTNGNNVKDNDEMVFPNGYLNYTVNNGDEITLNTDSNQYYIFDNNDSNSYDFEYVIEDSFIDYFSVESPTILDQYIIPGEIINYDIPIDITTPYDDIAINITPVNSPNPGFDTEQLITYQNLGSSYIAAGTITYTFDVLTTFVSSSNLNATLSANTLTIPFTDLAPFETRTIDITLNTNTPPDVNIDDILTFSADITADGINDINLDDNTFEINVTVIGSFDPNDKLEGHGGTIVYEDFTTDNYLFYTIRFQNTGSASAQNVVIKDFLTDELNANTIIMLSASHSYQLKIDEQDLEWEFRNINLPDSTNDEPNSKGFISFKIKPTTGYDIDTVFENTAEILFDFNLPIITNTSITAFTNRLNIDKLVKTKILLYPNPTNGTIFITSKTVLTHLKMTNVLGQTLISKPLNTLETSLELQPYADGSYFITLQSDDGEITKRIIKN